MAGGAKLLGEGVVERGKGVGPRRVWEGGWDKGAGEGGGDGGVGRGFNRSFEQNRYRYIYFGYRNAHYETKSAEIAFFGGFPQFLAGNPRGMTSQSRKNVIISPEKVRKRDVREISPNYLCKKKQPYWKTEKLPHFEFLNLNISLLNGRQVLIFEI